MDDVPEAVGGIVSHVCARIVLGEVPYIVSWIIEKPVITPADDDDPASFRNGFVNLPADLFEQLRILVRFLCRREPCLFAGACRAVATAVAARCGGLHYRTREIKKLEVPLVHRR